MSVGLILLAGVSALVLFGIAQRVLDRMHLTDRAALVITALIFFGGLLPDLRLGPVTVNVGGALVPLGVCVWLLVKTDTRQELGPSGEACSPPRRYTPWAGCCPRSLNR